MKKSSRAARRDEGKRKTDVPAALKSDNKKYKQLSYEYKHAISSIDLVISNLSKFVVLLKRK